MAKNRSYQTDKTKKDPFHVGTIDSDQLRKFDRAAKRLDRIAFETRSGAGSHEPTKRDRKRADRRAGKRQSRNWE